MNVCQFMSLPHAHTDARTQTETYSARLHSISPTQLWPELLQLPIKKHTAASIYNIINKISTLKNWTSSPMTYYLERKKKVATLGHQKLFKSFYFHFF